jgi:hypothetical protein
MRYSGFADGESGLTGSTNGVVGFELYFAIGFSAVEFKSWVNEFKSWVNEYSHYTTCTSF